MRLSQGETALSLYFIYFSQKSVGFLTFSLRIPDSPTMFSESLASAWYTFSLPDACFLHLPAKLLGLVKVYCLPKRFLSNWKREFSFLWIGEEKAQCPHSLFQFPLSWRGHVISIYSQLLSYTLKPLLILSMRYMLRSRLGTLKCMIRLFFCHGLMPAGPDASLFLDLRSPQYG